MSLKNIEMARPPGVSENAAKNAATNAAKNAAENATMTISEQVKLDSGLGKGEGCTAMGDILKRIGDKWSVMIVGSLRSGPVRFNQLRRRIDGISQRMLTLSLKNLERDGLVTRTHYPQIPPKVEYALTPLGETLLPVIGALWDWATDHHGDISDARQAYDQTIK